MTGNYHRTHRLMAWLMAVAVFVTPLAALGQTRIKYHSNKFSIQDDVKLGRQAASEVERQLPVMRDEEVAAYVERVGQRLVNAIPSQFQHREFDYYFKVLNARDINAFALPGGPMYVNRGMIEAARNEGEMAGVMAHELSHVALRHGTAQATKAQKYQYGAVAGAILGAIIGGGLGQVVGQGSQLAVGAYFLKYSREYETEADILGAQIMANAEYDPRDLANMFRTIEQQGKGRGGPEWLSSHPNPGNRYARISQEASLLQVSANPIKETPEFRRIQARLRGMGRAPSMQEIGRTSGQNYPGDYRQGRVELPSTRYRSYTAGNLFQVSVPSNWREFAGNSSVTFAPEGAYGNYQGQSVFTHGAQIGVERTQNRDLRRASDEFVSSLLQGNSYLRQESGYRGTSMGGRNALAVLLNGRSNVTGRSELLTVYTTMLRNGDLLYILAVAPQDEYNSYQRAFQDMLRSIRIND